MKPYTNMSDQHGIGQIPSHGRGGPNPTVGRMWVAMKP